MYSRARLVVKYLKYFLSSSSGRGHGIHSPFVFEFIQKVLNDKKAFPEYFPIEKLRKKLLADHAPVAVEDFGARATDFPVSYRSVAAIAANSAKSPKYGQLLFRIVRHYTPARILELGTSLGLSTAYLAAGNADAQLVTGEGNRAHASLARKNLDSLGFLKVRIVSGQFDDTLPQMLEALPGLDLAFIDGNHRKEPTLRYFNQLFPKLSPSAAVIIDDIHWSEDMEAAWSTISQDPRVLLSVDLFFMGILFFRPDFKVKQHFVIRF